MVLNCRYYLANHIITSCEGHSVAIDGIQELVLVQINCVRLNECHLERRVLPRLEFHLWFMNEFVCF